MIEYKSHKEQTQDKTYGAVHQQMISNFCSGVNAKRMMVEPRELDTMLWSAECGGILRSLNIRAPLLIKGVADSLSVDYGVLIDKLSGSGPKLTPKKSINYDLFIPVKDWVNVGLSSNVADQSRDGLIPISRVNMGNAGAELSLQSMTRRNRPSDIGVSAQIQAIDVNSSRNDYKLMCLKLRMLVYSINLYHSSSLDGITVKTIGGEISIVHMSEHQALLFSQKYNAVFNVTGLSDADILLLDAMTYKYPSQSLFRKNKKCIYSLLNLPADRTLFFSTSAARSVSRTAILDDPHVVLTRAVNMLSTLGGISDFVHVFSRTRGLCHSLHILMLTLGLVQLNLGFEIPMTHAKLAVDIGQKSVMGSSASISELETSSVALVMDCVMATVMCNNIHSYAEVTGMYNDKLYRREDTMRLLDIKRLHDGFSRSTDSPVQRLIMPSLIGMSGISGRYMDAVTNMAKIEESNDIHAHMYIPISYSTSDRFGMGSATLMRSPVELVTTTLNTVHNTVDNLPKILDTLAYILAVNLCTGVPKGGCSYIGHKTLPQQANECLLSVDRADGVYKLAHIYTTLPYVNRTRVANSFGFDHYFMADVYNTEAVYIEEKELGNTMLGRPGDSTIDLVPRGSFGAPDMANGESIPQVANDDSPVPGVSEEFEPYSDAISIALGVHSLVPVEGDGKDAAIRAMCHGLSTQGTQPDNTCLDSVGYMKPGEFSRDRLLKAVTGMGCNLCYITPDTVEYYQSGFSRRLVIMSEQVGNDGKVRYCYGKTGTGIPLGTRNIKVTRLDDGAGVGDGRVGNCVQSPVNTTGLPGVNPVVGTKHVTISDKLVGSTTAGVSAMSNPLPSTVGSSREHVVLSLSPDVQVMPWDRRDGK